MSCENECGQNPDLVRRTQADNVVYVEAQDDRHLSRRGLLKAAGAALATIGFSSASSMAFAAAVATTKTYTLTNSKTDKWWPKVGSATRYVLKMDTIKSDDGGRTKVEREDTMIIVTQPKAGIFRAFKGLCTHQLQPLDGLKGSNLVCSRHGAMFDTTTGINTSPPRNFGNRSVPALRNFALTIDPQSGIVTITA